MKRETKIGTFRKNQKGFGFVKLDDQEDEIYIAKEHSLNALNGDTVSVEIIVPQDKANNKKEEGLPSRPSFLIYELYASDRLRLLLHAERSRICLLPR